MAQVAARGRERPTREDTRRPSRDEEDEEDDDPDDDNYDPENDEDGNAAPTDEDDTDMDKDPRDAQIAQMRKSLAQMGKQLERLTKAQEPEVDPDDYVSETYTTEALFKGIGAEFGLALSPLVARLEAIEEGYETVSKALDQAGVIWEEVSDKQDIIQKALAGASPEAITKALAVKETETAKHTPAEGETVPTGAVTTDDILSKDADGDALSDDEKGEVSELLVKAQRLARDYSIQADGYEDAVDAMNEGKFNRATYQALRKGVEVASSNAKRLVKA